MTEDDVIFDDEDWEPVSSGEYNDLKFVKPGKEEAEEGEHVLEAGDYVQGTFQGVKELGGVPNFKVENAEDETDYMFSVQMVLESEFEAVEDGSLVRVRFDGEKENEDGTRSYFDWSVLQPKQ